MDDVIEIQPNANLVRIVSWAISVVQPKLTDTAEPWRKWASAWLVGQRQPGACVNMARWCFSQHTELFHALAQIAWAAKEACYTTRQSPWLVLRYVGDAMIAFNVAFRDDVSLMAPQLGEATA